MSVALVIFLLFLRLRLRFQFYKKNKRLMAKKKLDKEAERTSSSPGKIAAILKNEPVGGQQSCEELRRFAWGAVGSLLD